MNVRVASVSRDPVLSCTRTLLLQTRATHKYSTPAAQARPHACMPEWDAAVRAATRVQHVAAGRGQRPADGGNARDSSQGGTWPRLARRNAPSLVPPALAPCASRTALRPYLHFPRPPFPFPLTPSPPARLPRRQIVENCRIYNAPDTIYFKLANKVKGLEGRATAWIRSRTLRACGMWGQEQGGHVKGCCGWEAGQARHSPSTNTPLLVPCHMHVLGWGNRLCPSPATTACCRSQPGRAPRQLPSRLPVCNKHAHPIFCSPSCLHPCAHAHPRCCTAV